MYASVNSVPKRNNKKKNNNNNIAHTYTRMEREKKKKRNWRSKKRNREKCNQCVCVCVRTSCNHMIKKKFMLFSFLFTSLRPSSLLRWMFWCRSQVLHCYMLFTQVSRPQNVYIYMFRAHSKPNNSWSCIKWEWNWEILWKEEKI